jgi:hypothetical protein
MIWTKVYVVLAALWWVRLGVRAAGRTAGPWAKRSGVVANIGALVALAHSTLVLGTILLTFYRAVFVVVAAGVVAIGAALARRRTLTSAWVVVLAAALPMAGAGCSWWNFLMIGARPFDPVASGPDIRAVATIEQMRAAGLDVGEAHPYWLAYDPGEGLLVASFKDDWGAVFPRRGARVHNFLLACSTRDGDPRLRIARLGPREIPENIALRPGARRGWVNVLDLDEQRFRLIEFRVEEDGIAIVRSVELPVEPNAVFDDPARNRLLVFGIQMRLIELDPDTLAIRSSIELQPLLSSGDGALPLSAMSAVASDFDPDRNALYVAVVGRFVHRVDLKTMEVRRALSFPLVDYLTRLDGSGALVAAMPMQHRLLILDAESMAIRRQISVGIAPRPVAALTGTPWILAGGYGNNSTTLVNAQTGAIGPVHRLGRLQRAAVSDPTRPRAFVATGLGVFEVRAPENR